MAADQLRLSIYFDVEGRQNISRGAESLELLSRRFSELASKADGYSRSFKAVIRNVNQASTLLHGKLSRSLVTVNRLFEESFNLVNRLVRYGFYKLTLELGAAAFAAQRLFKEFLNINEQFAGLQITLKSAFKSQQAAKAIREELVRITAESPVPFEDLAAAARSLAVVPQLSKLVAGQVGDSTLSDQSGFFRRYMRLVEQMLAFRPDKQVKDVIFSLREAATGELRSLIRRFDFPPGLLVSASGRSIKDLRTDPEGMINAIKGAMDRIISPQAVKELAYLPKNLFANIKEQLLQIPLLRIGEAGLFRNFTGFFDRLYQPLISFMKKGFTTPSIAAPSKDKSLAVSISDSMSSVFYIVADEAKKLAEKALSAVGFGTEDRPDLGPIQRFFGGVAAAAEKAAKYMPTAIEKAKNFFNTVTPIIAGLATAVSKVVGMFASFVGNSPYRLAALLVVWRSLPALVAKIGGSLVTRNVASYQDARLGLATAMLRARVPVSAAGTATGKAGNAVLSSTVIARAGLDPTATVAMRRNLASAGLTLTETNKEIDRRRREALLRRTGRVYPSATGRSVTWRPPIKKGVVSTPYVIGLGTGNLPRGMPADIRTQLAAAGYRAVTRTSIADLGRELVAARRSEYQALLNVTRKSAGPVTSRIGAFTGAAAMGMGASVATASSVTAGAMGLTAMVGSVIAPILIMVVATAAFSFFIGKVSQYMDRRRQQRGQENKLSLGILSKADEQRVANRSQETASYIQRLNAALAAKGLSTPQVNKNISLLTGDQAIVKREKEPANVFEYRQRQQQAARKKLLTDPYGELFLTAPVARYRTGVDDGLKFGGPEVTDDGRFVQVRAKITEERVNLKSFLNRYQTLTADFKKLSDTATNFDSKTYQLTSAPGTLVKGAEQAKQFAEIIKRSIETMQPTLNALSGVTDAVLGIKYERAYPQKIAAKLQRVRDYVDAVTKGDLNTAIGTVGGTSTTYQSFTSRIGARETGTVRAAIISRGESSLKQLQQQFTPQADYTKSFENEKKRLGDLLTIRKELTSWTATDQASGKVKLEQESAQFIESLRQAAKDSAGNTREEFANLETILATYKAPVLATGLRKNIELQLDSAIIASVKDSSVALYTRVATLLPKALSAKTPQQAQAIVDSVLALLTPMFDQLVQIAENKGFTPKQLAVLQESQQGYKVAVRSLANKPTGTSVNEDLQYFNTAQTAAKTLANFGSDISSLMKKFGATPENPETSAAGLMVRPLQSALNRGSAGYITNYNQQQARSQQTAFGSLLAGQLTVGDNSEQSLQTLASQLQRIRVFLNKSGQEFPKILSSFSALSKSGREGYDLRIEELLQQRTAVNNLLPRVREQVTTLRTMNAAVDVELTVPGLDSETVKRLTSKSATIKARLQSLTADLLEPLLNAYNVITDKVDAANYQRTQRIRRRTRSSYDQIMGGRMIRPGHTGSGFEEQTGGFNKYLGTFGVAPPARFDFTKLQGTPITQVEGINRTQALYELNSKLYDSFQAKLTTVNENTQSQAWTDLESELSRFRQGIRSTTEQLELYRREQQQQGRQSLSELTSGQVSLRGGPEAQLLAARKKAQATAALTREGYVVPRALGNLTGDFTRTSAQVSALEASRSVNNSLAAQALQKSRAGGSGAINYEYQQQYERFIEAAKEAGLQLEALQGKNKSVLASAYDGFSQMADHWAATATNWTDVGVQAATTITSSFTDAWMSVIDGSKTASEAFSDFGRNVLRTMAQMAVQKTTESIFGAVIGAISGAAGGLLGKVAGNVAGSVGGAVSSGIGPAPVAPSVSYNLQYAEGGLIPGLSSDQDSLLIKAAPGEFVIPSKTVREWGADHFRQYLPGATDTTPGYASGGLISGPALSPTRNGGGSINAPVTVNVTVNESGKTDSSVKADSAMAKELGEGLQATVIAVLTEQMRQGGTLRQ